MTKDLYQNKYAILINKENPIPDAYYKTLKIVKATNDEGVAVPIEEKTAEAFASLKAEVAGTELDVLLYSGYRSLERQASLYARFLSELGLDLAEARVAKPGCSEHNAGIGLDISVKIDDVWQDDFDSEECVPKLEALHGKLFRHGFILRYPKGKESVTGYSYEPWHIRYVGRELAGYMYQKGLTLEELWGDEAGRSVMGSCDSSAK